jgi:hypothetical protein|tara:strand:- start:22 stop:336 length:315 start_codon:yes stop_codon:yes gene_type:complete
MEILKLSVQAISAKLNTFMSKIEVKLFGGYLLFLLAVLMLAMLTSCSSGWSVAGYELTPQDTSENTVFIEIVSSDSVSHWYSDKIYHGDNWCYKHGIWEDVRIK